jgi:hypothetical protein
VSFRRISVALYSRPEPYASGYRLISDVTRTVALGWTLLVLSQCDPALAQQQQDERSGVTAGVETTRDRFHYRFENPSSFGTAELVPHEFTQTYWADNRWLVVRARFGPSQHLFEGEFAVTPSRTTRGDDYDTFFQPTGDIAVTGTTGDVAMRSWRARQTIGLGRGAGLDWNIGYEFRHDRSVFGPGLKTITHTQPASLESSIISTRETTVSAVYGLVIGLDKRWNAGNWSGALGIEASPAARARLTTLLPDKYPGQAIVFAALVAGVDPSVTLSYGRHWPVSLTAGYFRTFSYTHSSQFVRDSARLEVGMGWSR